MTNPPHGTIVLIVLLSILAFICHITHVASASVDPLETEIHWYKCNLFTNERRNTTRPTPATQQYFNSDTRDPSLTKEDVDKLISTVSRWMQRGGMDPSEFESPLNVVTRKEREILPMLARRNALSRTSAAVPHTEESLPYAPVAECAQVYIPLNYSKPNGRKIEVFVKRIRPEIQEGSSMGTHAKASKQLWLLQGGPGGSSDGWIERMMHTLYLHYDGEYELYTMDHRGVGRSTRLACDGSQAETIGSEDGTAISANEMYDCAKEIVDKYGKDNDKDGFSTTGAAEDLKHIIELTKTPEHTTFVYGVSYGTLWASRMMQLPGIEDLVRGVILDGLCPQTTDIKYKWPTRDIGTNDAGMLLMKRCAEDTEYCGAKLGANAANAVQDVFKKLYEENHCPEVSDFLDADTLRLLLGSTLAGTVYRAIPPAVVYRLNRCDPEKDVPVLKHLVDKLLNQPPGNCPSLRSSVLGHHIAFVERWRTDEPRNDNEEKEIWDLFRKSYFSFGVATNMVPYHKDWPLYEPDEYFWKAFEVSKTKVLMLNGDLDAQTPANFAQLQYELVKTPNDAEFKHLAMIPNAGHGTISGSAVKGELDCGMQILLSFLDNPDEKPDMSCIDRVADVDYKGDPLLMKSLFGTDNIYDGALPGQETDVQLVAIIVLACLAGGLALFAVVQMALNIFLGMKMYAGTRSKYSTIN